MDHFLVAQGTGSRLRTTTFGWEHVEAIPYFTPNKQLEVLLKGKRGDIKHAIETPIAASKAAAVELRARIEKALRQDVKTGKDISQMLYRLMELKLFYGVWQHNYREAFLRDEDSMEEMDVEDFYEILNSAWR